MNGSTGSTRASPPKPPASTCPGTLAALSGTILILVPLSAAATNVGGGFGLVRGMEKILLTLLDVLIHSASAMLLSTLFYWVGWMVTKSPSNRALRLYWFTYLGAWLGGAIPLLAMTGSFTRYELRFMQPVFILLWALAVLAGTAAAYFLTRKVISRPS